jgi:hypothetical protein
VTMARPRICPVNRSGMRKTFLGTGLREAA